MPCRRAAQVELALMRDQKGIDFDAAGHLAVSAFDEIGQELTADLAAWGVPADRIHTEIFGTLDPITLA